MKKILCIVQARMGSTRLPGKVLKEINGHPMIYYTLTSLKKSRYIDEVVLATSNKKIDTPLAEYVKTLGFEVFRGSEANVLERYKLAADKYGGDVIVRVTGDCPLINPIITDNVITKYLMYEDEYDYVRLDVPNTFTRGFDTEVFSKEALDKVYEIACSNKNINKKEFEPFREHVTYYIYNHQNEFKVGVVEGESKYCKDKEINMSVDTIEDFILAESKLK
ncbi:spore coat polysaccharide biosynthesis protein SpsF [Clostridium cavendishii DSM 21758]|uniref:Spore coat polysaccharide biosynthesis protein SpsF n=1 Tax=Clostridium cavendishii DSM 21758 TaxID=1121302 RepID=A0A1M6B0E7_9CLOT|nr:glycosyltransferase family protein [Clostridium cavendishii]SHI42190.1 spore coat polysaccharide biosynthesis protein SpsF [Clostridium cavendishii DSM 21758]